MAAAGRTGNVYISSFFDNYSYHDIKYHFIDKFNPKKFQFIINRNIYQIIPNFEGGHIYFNVVNHIYF